MFKWARDPSITNPMATIDLASSIMGRGKSGMIVLSSIKSLVTKLRFLVILAMQSKNIET
jgi:hypothetical protein